MKKTLLVAGGIALLAGWVTYHFFSLAKNDTRYSSAVDEHAQRVKGEKEMRRAMHKYRDRWEVG